jgi:hypothetical protein
VTETFGAWALPVCAFGVVRGKVWLREGAGLGWIS